MKDNLRLVLKNFAAFEEKELDQIVSYFRPRSVKKNSMLLQEGMVNREFYYIHTGCIRTYFIDRKGYEKTRYIVLDNQIGTSLTSFISQKPSFECMDALEDTELLAINNQDFYLLNKVMDHWKSFYQRILERAYSFQNRRIEALVTLTAKQRFDQLIKMNPILAQRVSNRILASYLDMREETLSRLKAQ